MRRQLPIPRFAISFVFAFGLACSVTIAGCGGSESETPAPASGGSGGGGSGGGGVGGGGVGGGSVGGGGASAGSGGGAIDAGGDATGTDGSSDGSTDARGDSSLDARTDAADSGTACSAPLQGLVSWWQGENGCEDVFGVNGGATPKEARFAAGGKVGAAFSFIGAANSYVPVQDSSSISLTTAITLDAWINATSLGGRIVDKITAGGSDGYLLDTYQDKLRLVIGSHLLSSGASLKPSTWTHVAGTYDGTRMVVYIDGVEAGAVAASGAIPTASRNLRIGADSNDAARFNGLIDEVRIFNRALSATEINNLYLAGNAKAGIVSWWHGESSFDDALGVNHGSNAGAAGFASGPVGQGFNLTGATGSYVEVADSDSLDLDSAITMDAWIVPTTLGTWIFDKYLAGEGGYLLDTYQDTLRLIVGTGVTVVRSTSTLPTGVATHVAGTFGTASGLAKIYINGVLSGTVARADGLGANTLPLHIGASKGEFRFSGVIDEPRIFNRELSAAEIAALYHEVRCD